jgi:ABC-type Mn2+/Zn2+ transport system permease subunit
MKIESGNAIAGGAILGMGIGFLLNNMMPFMMIGTGIGFFIEFAIGLKTKKEDEK